MESGNIAWMLVATAMVLFMVPGLALFYGGMVRSKNTLNMLLMNMFCLGIVPVVWVLVSYTLGNSGNDEGESGFFGGDFIGNFDNIGLRGLTGDIEGLVFVGFLMTFAAITPALISGAVAGRLKFSAWAVFVPLWLLLVYTPVTYWVYTGWFAHGTEGGLDALDFAGGTAIHINAGVAALAFVLVLGKRRGWPGEPMFPHSLPLVLIGTGILWFGWFGFNAGSAGAADGIAVQAFLNTFLAAAVGMLAWMAVEWTRDGNPTVLGACSGAVAGLVAITPAAGFVGGLSPLVFGLVAGVGCYAAVQLKSRLGYDDSLDVVGVHMVGGLIGGFLLGVFADPAATGDSFEQLGVFFGGADIFAPESVLLDQVLSMAITLAFSFVVTFGLVKVLDATIGLRASDEDETIGLDQTEHAETAYHLSESSSFGGA